MGVPESWSWSCPLRSPSVRPAASTLSRSWTTAPYPDDSAGRLHPADPVASRGIGHRLTPEEAAPVAPGGGDLGVGEDDARDGVPHEPHHHRRALWRLGGACVRHEEEAGGDEEGQVVHDGVPPQLHGGREGAHKAAGVSLDPVRPRPGGLEDEGALTVGGGDHHRLEGVLGSRHPEERDERAPGRGQRHLLRHQPRHHLCAGLFREEGRDGGEAGGGRQDRGQGGEGAARPGSRGHRGRGVGLPTAGGGPPG